MADTLKTSIRIEVLDAFTAPLRKLGGQLKTVGGALEKAGKGFKLAADLNQAAEAAGRFGMAITGALKAPVDEFKGFEKQMSSVAAISGEIGTENFDKLRKQALELGASTSFTAEQAAAAMTEYAVAGRTANEILAVTPLTLSLARASGEELASTAEILGSAMSGLGLDASQTARAADVLTNTFTSSATTLSSLGESLKFVGPIAKQANIAIEDVSAMIGVLGNAGIRGSEAGTGLRAVFLRMLGPMRRAEKELAGIGIRGKVLKELQKDLGEGNVEKALHTIAAATSALPDQERIKVLSKIFGQEAVTAASVLLDASVNTSDKGLHALAQANRDVEGTTNRLAAVMEDNLAGELTRTSSAISGLAIQVGEKLKPGIMGLAGSVQGAVGAIATWVDENPKLANALLRVTAIAGLTGLALKGLLLTMSTLTSAVTVLRFAVNALRVAYIVTRAVTVALSSAMYTALIPAFVKTRIAALAASVASAGMATKILGGAGLVLAAGAAGYAIGRWADETWGLSEKMTKAIDAIAVSVLGLESIEHNKREKRAGGESKTITYADGTVMDREGNVISLGTGPASAAPKPVREARAMGHSTVEAMNAFLGERRAREQQRTGSSSFNVVETALAAPAPRAGVGTVLLDAPAAPAPAAPRPVGPVQPPGGGDPATREQTQRLERATRDTEKATREVLEELKRGNRQRSRVPSAGAGQGAF